MGLLTFKGGVHPNDGKSLAKDKAIVEPVSYTHLDVYKRQD